MDQPVSRHAIARRFRLRLVTALALMATCGAAAWGINRAVSPSLSLADVMVAEVRRGSIANTINASGIVIPVHEGLVSSPIQTRVAKVIARPGQSVAAGELLLELDDHAILLAIDSLKEQLAQQENRILGLTAEMEQKRKQFIGNIELLELDLKSARVKHGHFFDRGFARHFLLIEELTDELESSEKATYEKLIRVLAHEVNNTVAATGSVLESLLFYSPQLTERDSVDFSTAIVAVKRRNTSLGEFIERFTQVVKMPVPELRPAALGAMVDDILWLYREQCRSRGIEIGWAECEAVPPQAMDTQLMEQALLNIVKNAMEAVEESGLPGGRVRLALTRDELGVRLSVSDSGNRLGALPAGQLFTPFFSTKKGGQGIGLLFVREVLNRHGFPYRLAATGDGETRFDIWFP